MLFRRIAFIALALVGGCGSDNPNSNGDGGDGDAGAGGCAAMGKDAPAYTGDSAGALAMTRPIVMQLAPDATLATIEGSGITLNGQTTGNSGSWVVTFYSPSQKHNFIGAFSGASGHVGCQDIKVPNPPDPEPNPQLTSQDVMTTAVTQIRTSYPNAMLPPTAQDLIYGKVAAGGKPPVDKAWKLTLSPIVVIVDDATNKVVYCAANGMDCP